MIQNGILDSARPRWAVPFRQPARYKGAHGGRGSGKSHLFSEDLIKRCMKRRTRAVCIREVQNTIRDSVRQLLLDKVAKFGVGPMFHAVDAEIRGPNGSLIVFRGMQSYNADNIKSLEDFDIAWVEEAQTLSQRSLDLLRPTIRAPGSELWFSWNPRHETDAVDVFFRGGKPPSDAIVVEVNWQDNPWFPDVLRQEMLEDYANDPERAAHVWGGGYETVSEAAYYAKWIADAEAEGRVGDFPHLPHLPVHTSWDIGVDDYTAIWFWQENGVEARVIDFYETQNDGADQIVADALPEYGADMRAAAQTLIEIERPRPFRYGRHYLPHDVKMREWGAGARSRVETLIGLGLRNITKGAALGPEERIPATRKLLPLVRFNLTPRTKIGLAHLRRYARKRNEQMGVWQGPLHDEHSHAADAFGEFAINGPIKPERPKPAPKPAQPPGGVVLAGAPDGGGRKFERI